MGNDTDLRSVKANEALAFPFLFRLSCAIPFRSPRESNASPVQKFSSKGVVA